MNLRKNRVTLMSLAALLVALSGSGRADQIVDFDDLSLAPNSYWSGPDPNGTILKGPYGDVNAGRFTSHGTTFNNRYGMTYGNWSGFAYSNTTDTTTPGYQNQFSAFTGSGRGPGADNYGVAFGYAEVEPTLFDPDPFDPSDPAQLKSLPTFIMPVGSQIAGMFVTNTTYAALSMLRGDSFARKFGGPSGDDPDWFKLTAYGTDAEGKALGVAVDFYLADFRFEDNSLDYVVSDWRYVDLSSLSGAAELHFNVSSSDVGPYGMNTPGYFAVDDILLTTAAVPEPSSIAPGMIAGLVGLCWARLRVPKPG